MSLYKIQIKAGKPAVFDPNPRIVYVNDSVFWYNGDPGVLRISKVQCYVSQRKTLA